MKKLLIYLTILALSQGGVLARDYRPRAWCGWWLRQELGIRDASYNLARNWVRIGHRASPGSGVIAVWPHHVGLIIALTHKGMAIVKSGNDSGAVRQRERSLAGVIAYRVL